MKQAKLLESRTSDGSPLASKEKLPTNLTTGRYPIHRWFNITAGFSPEFVKWCIQDARLSADEILIDPFAGLSTALVQANFEGVVSVGFEPHPFFYDMSLAKILPPENRRQIDAIESKCLSLSPYEGQLTEIWTNDAATFLMKLLPERELRLLASALLVEEENEPEERPLYRLVVSRGLELAAKSRTDGIYKAPATRKNSTPYHIAIRRVCKEIRKDILSVSDNYSRQARLFRMSSQDMTPLDDGS